MMTFNDYRILAAILSDDDKDKGIIAIKGTTKTEIKTKTELSSSKINNTLSSLVKDELVSNGLKQNNCNTYIITKKGLEELLKMKGVVEND